jgi:endo-1,4-beta-xylanase
MIGNIFNPSDISSSEVTDKMLTRHYNALTAENHMKPDQISTGKGTYNFTTTDRMVNAAIASGFKVVGHTLLWHSQIPQWQTKHGGSGQGNSP